MENLARQLVVLVDDADDIIDFHVANQLREGSQDKSLHVIALTSFCQYIDKIIEKIDSITDKLTMVKEEQVDVQQQQLEVSMPVGSTALPYSDEITMVGFDERLLQVVDELTRDESNLQILPIVGMGGIGKTTLAQNAFDHPYIVNRFDIRIWFTISQQYSVQKILRKYFFNDEKDIADASPLVCEACNNMYPDLNRLRWVKVFDLDNDQSVETFPQHTKLRYLAVEDRHVTMVDYLLEWKIVFPNTISLLWNLQILDLDLFYMDTHTLVLSSEIWEIPKLRHLNVRSYRLPDPPVNDLEGQDFTILEYLSTLSSEGFKCLEEVVKRIPNLKKLNASYQSYSGDVSDCSLNNLAQFNKLESLSLKSYSFLEDLTFPASLKKLSLSSCEIPWEKMTIIGSSLPNLEVLKLNNAFHRQEWDPTEGEFLRLKVLYVSCCDLMLWGAEDIHFPNLQCHSLEDMFKLEEIPLSIGDITTLHSIHLDFCSESAINSAMEILTEQKENGNESLRVYVNEKQVSVSL
ncbi:UNVERIFIED_CONTAM: Disease resistance RPP13-like protein 4 [Sesamum calycinum]|uniref:Disease resistance RPP13-like protein 4 n=1 Tax=Sesamum calycinum TaxID=2727403 RepID=A0AAW2ND20_9LAMI